MRPTQTMRNLVRYLTGQPVLSAILITCCVSACSPGGGDTSGTSPSPGPGPTNSGSGSVATGSPGGPVILFTDAEAGPKQGGPGNHGVPITLFGTGFGAQRGTSTITINGVEAANYLVWGEHNANNAALDMLVIQPGPNVTTGPMVVHVNGKDSNTDYSFTPTNGIVYYVAPGGSDAAACSEAAPCATVHHVATNRMQSGDAVLIRGGTLTEGEVWIRDDMGHSGQPDRPKLIRNYPGENPIFSNAARPFIISANYITVSGLHFQNGKSLGLGGETNHHNQVINSTFRGLIDWDAIGSHGSDHVIAGNDCNVSGSTVGTQGHCYYISFGNNVKVRYNVGSGAPGYGVHVFDQQRATNDFRRVISNLLIEGNTLTGSTRRAGLIVAMGDEGNRGNVIDGVDVRNNTFSGNAQLGAVVGPNVRNVTFTGNSFVQNGNAGSANNVCKIECTWYRLAHVTADPAVRGVVVDGNRYLPGPPIVEGAVDARPLGAT